MLAKVCSENNVKKIVHLSALGISKKTKSKYMLSKKIGEENLLNNFKNTYILRPSVIFGPEDKFFNKFASLAQFFPALPLIGGGKTKFQPIYVGDVAKAILATIQKEELENNIFELGGPQIFTFKELMEILLKQIQKKRLLLPISFSLARYQAKMMQLLPTPLLTEDQVEMLKYDNVISGEYPTIKDLNIDPKTIDSILPDYIYRFRKGGQFAKNFD